MDDEKLAELLPAFSKIYYFIKPHSYREYPRIRESGRFKITKKEPSVRLEAEDYSVLWLIQMFCGKSKHCLEIDVKKAFLWKRHGDINKFTDTIIPKLDCAGLINKSFSNRNGKPMLELTEEGINLLNKLEEERIVGLKELFTVGLNSLNKLNEISVGRNQQFLEILMKRISHKLWSNIKSESAKIKVSERIKTNND